MKVFCLLLLCCVLTVHAQRRTSSTRQDAESTTPKTPRGRGKTRFSSTPEFAEISTERSSNRRTTIRSRTSNTNSQPIRSKPTPTPLRSRTYEVEETINESPIDSFRRTSRPRVLTENAFIAPNAGERTPLFRPTPEEIPVEDILSTFGSTARSIAAQNAARQQASGSRADSINYRSPFINTRNDPAATKDILSSFGNTARAIAAQNGGNVRQPSRTESISSRKNEISPTRNENNGRRGRTRGEPAAASRSASRSENLNSRSENLNSRSENLNSRSENSNSRNDNLNYRNDNSNSRSENLSSRNENLNGRGRSETQRTTIGSRTIPVTRIEPRTSTQPSTSSTRLDTSSIPSTRAEIATIPAEYSQSDEEIDESFEADITTLKASSYEISSESANIENEVKKEPVRVNTPLDELPTPRKSVVRRINTRPRDSEEEPTPSRSRSRSRGSRRQNEDHFATSQTRNVPRAASRRQSQEIKARGPSVFNAEENIETRSRTERRIDTSSRERRVGTSSPEKINLEIPSRDRTAVRSRSYSPVSSSTTTTTARSETIRGRGTSRFSSRERGTVRESIREPVREQSSSSRNRGRSRNLPPVIDEQKLEVLPLFESESKTVRPTKGFNRSRSRSFNSAEDVVQLSATENDIRVVTKPRETTTKISITKSEPIQTTTKAFRNRKPIIKESVISEVNEATTKRSLPTRVKIDKPKVSVSQVITTSKGRKKASKVIEEKKQSSEEEIDEGDNYPEPFKALIQAKKSKSESRPSPPRLPQPKTTERSTTTSNSRATSTVPSAVPLDDNENELVPKSSPASLLPSTTRARKRTHSTTTTTTTEKSSPTTNRRTSTRISSELLTKPIRNLSSRTTSTTSTTTTSPPSRGSLPITHRFHAKFTTKTEVSSTPKSIRSVPQKASTRGVYSSRKKETDVEEKKSRSGKKSRDEQSNANNNSRQISKSSIKSRYSSRYRNDISQRAGSSRSTTSAPFYTPTVPTVVYSPTASSKSRRTTVYGGKDRDLGLEVISFDDPVNTIQSANLVNGELLTPEKVFRVTASSLVQDKVTEKPLSIIESIERIINSVTSISSTTTPSVTTTTPTTTTTEEPTKSSAILKLATKKSTKDKTKPDKTLTADPALSITSENPTTIIEKILSSLSAIQNDESNQVGRDYNTLSSQSTTPIVPQVTKKYSSKYSSNKLSLAAPSSTSINPLSILNEITEEEIKQKRTIGQLLSILNGLTTTVPPEELVVVTPKNALFSRKGRPSAFSTASPLSSTTLVPSTTTLFIPSSEDTTSEKVSASVLFTPSTTESTLFTSATSELPSTSISTTSTTQTQTSTASATTQSLDTKSALETTRPTTETTSAATTTTAVPVQMSTKAASSNELDSMLAQSTISESSTQNMRTTPDKVTTEASSTAYTIVPTTIPTLINFEVSPGSVSVFSANDVSNYITPEENLFNTVTISGRANFDPTATTDSTTTELSTESATESSTIPPDVASSTSTTEISTTTDAMPSSTTIVTNMSNNNVTNRNGKRLDFSPDPVSNNIDSVTPSTTTSTTPDYFIFAVLNNNTILRKRPPTIPNRQTPFLIVGVYPNNTIVRKFPNGTLVPMEQIIRVRGFDTRENPPPLPEITSNQVTEGSPQNSQTVPQSRMPRVNPLSVDNSTTASPTSTSANPTTTTPVPSTTIQPISTTAAPTTSTTPSTTTAVPITTLSEILNGMTVDALKTIINSTSITSTSTTTSAPISSSPNFKTLTTNQIPTSTGFSNIGTTSTIPPFTSAIETTTPIFTTSTFTSPPRTITTISAPTSVSVNNKIQFDTTTTPRTTTTKQPRFTTTPVPTLPPNVFPSTTLLPTFLTTLFPNIFAISPVQTTTTSNPAISIRPFYNNQDNFILSASTVQPTTVPVATTTEPTTTTRRTTTRRITTTTTVPTTTTVLTTTTTTNPPTTTVRRTRPTRVRTTTTEAPIVTSTIPTTTTTKVETTTKKLKELTEEQKKNLEAIVQLEKQQAELLKQLSFLTNLNFAGLNNRANSPNVESTTYNSLANRAISIAMQKAATSTKSPPRSIQDQIAAIEASREPKKEQGSLEEVLKQYNVSVVKGVDLTPSINYGKSQDAILASILKEQGIGPSTPKSLEGIFEETTTTRRPKKQKPRTTQTPPGGRLRQGLGWLLSALAPPPPTTRRPKAKPKSKKPKVVNNDQELLTNQPTKITPVVTAAPIPAKVLSQAEIKELIKQLEDAQKDPKKADQLDFSRIKSLQNLIQVNDGVEVSSDGQNGASSKPSKKKSKTSTIKPATVSNSIDDDEEEEYEDHKTATSTTKARPSLPPLRLRPVAGLDDTDEPFIRPNLITAAVNVTRAISGFLGTALQDAASQVSNMFSNGSDNVRKILEGSYNDSLQIPPP